MQGRFELFHCPQPLPAVRPEPPCIDLADGGKRRFCASQRGESRAQEEGEGQPFSRHQRNPPITKTAADQSVGGQGYTKVFPSHKRGALIYDVGCANRGSFPSTRSGAGGAGAAACSIDAIASCAKRSAKSFNDPRLPDSLSWKPDFSATSRLISVPRSPCAGLAVAWPLSPLVPAAPPATKTRSGTSGWLLLDRCSATSARAYSRGSPNEPIFRISTDA